MGTDPNRCPAGEILIPSPKRFVPVPLQKRSEPFPCPGTCRIWSPSRTPWLSAGLPSCTPDTKMPTSLPPARRSPALLAFTKCTTLESALYLPGEPRSAGDSTGGHWPCDPNAVLEQLPISPRPSPPPLADSPVPVCSSGRGAGVGAAAPGPLHGFQQVCREGERLQGTAGAAPLPGLCRGVGQRGTQEPGAPSVS